LGNLPLKKGSTGGAGRQLHSGAQDLEHDPGEVDGQIGSRRRSTNLKRTRQAAVDGIVRQITWASIDKGIPAAREADAHTV
jgi:hypothetical protein